MKPDIARLNVQLTKRCNQRCKSCNSYELDATDELSLEEFKKLMDDAAHLFNLKNIAFTGGEPTIYPHILDVAAYARSKCEKVSITTNGWYCTSESRVKELLSAGINRFSFSYHGVGKQDEFTRTRGAESRLLKAIEYILALKSSYPCYVKIGTLYTGHNIDSVERVLEYAESKGLDLYIELLDTKIPVFRKSLLSTEKHISRSQGGGRCRCR